MKELPDVYAGFRKERGTRDQMANIHWTMEKAKAMLKPLTVWTTTNSGKFLKRWEYQTTCLLRNMYASQEATVLDIEQWTGSELGKEYVKAVYCHPDYLTYMQSTS